MEEVPRRFGRRKLKALYRYLGQVRDLDVLRNATGTRAAMGADAKGWEDYANALQSELSTRVETMPPLVDMDKEAARHVDTDDWEAVDDG